MTPLQRHPGAIAVGLLVLLLADISWITYARPMYARLVREVQRGAPMEVDRAAAVLAYALVAATYVLVVVPSLAVNGTERPPSLAKALARGALVGMLVYGIFNATNKAMFAAAYDVRTAVVDTMWGTTVFALAAGAYVTVAK